MFRNWNLGKDIYTGSDMVQRRAFDVEIGGLVRAVGIVKQNGYSCYVNNKLIELPNVTQEEAQRRCALEALDIFSAALRDAALALQMAVAEDECADRLARAERRATSYQQALAWVADVSRSDSSTNEFQMVARTALVNQGVL